MDLISHMNRRTTSCPSAELLPSALAGLGKSDGIVFQGFHPWLGFPLEQIKNGDNAGRRKQIKIVGTLRTKVKRYEYSEEVKTSSVANGPIPFHFRARPISNRGANVSRFDQVRATTWHSNDPQSHANKSIAK
ncbi:hypothetical protein [Bradyrhizobium icense]|nr:hypothetical protein [Bradyrhizobium icense]